MARFKRQNKAQDTRPVVSDDYIYDDTSSGENIVSDTPEEAIRKFRGRYSSDKSEDKAEPLSSDTGKKEAGNDQAVPDSADQDPASSDDMSDKDHPKHIYPGGVYLDENLQAHRIGKHPHRKARIVLLTIVTVFLLGIVAVMIFHGLYPGTRYLDLPDTVISGIITPVQDGFSSLSDAFFNWMRDLKLRANIEEAYEQLRAENEQLVYKAMLAEELQRTLSQYEDLSDEIAANKAMRPIVCTVIGRGDPTYFSTMTINKGTRDGVEDYMAVTFGGALVGYTESVTESKATVRTIIDSDASIAALIQSSRDQGTVRGTLGVDGTPLCRMYYLPDDNLPRPGDQVVTSGVGMSFPKGIPIGVVRESTRGMEANKQYIVLEPQVDFQHLEYVIVLRYKPEPEAIVGRENGRTNMELVPVVSARPSPQIPQIAASLFDSPTPSAEAAVAEETPSPSPSPSPTPAPATTMPVSTPDVPAPTSLEYQSVNLSDEPTPSPTPSPAPTPTPYWTPDPDDMTFEED